MATQKTQTTAKAIHMSSRISLSFSFLLVLGVGLAIGPVLLKPDQKNPQDITRPGRTMVQRGLDNLATRDQTHFHLLSSIPR